MKAGPASGSLRKIQSLNLNVHVTSRSGSIGDISMQPAGATVFQSISFDQKLQIVRNNGTT